MGDFTHTSDLFLCVCESEWVFAVECAFLSESRVFYMKYMNNNKYFGRLWSVTGLFVRDAECCCQRSVWRLKWRHVCTTAMAKLNLSAPVTHGLSSLSTLMMKPRPPPARINLCIVSMLSVCIYRKTFSHKALIHVFVFLLNIQDVGTLCEAISLGLIEQLWIILYTLLFKSLGSCSPRIHLFEK